MNSRTGRLVAVSFTVLLFVSLWLLPYKKDPVKVVNGSIEEQIAQAVKLVQEGQKPMEGILKLKKITEEDPKNVQALMALGQFSIQSGQTTNAIKRFEQVIAADPAFEEAHMLLGDLYEKSDQQDKALQSYSRVKELSNDKQALLEVEKRINRIKQTVTN